LSQTLRDTGADMFHACNTWHETHAIHAWQVYETRLMSKQLFTQKNDNTKKKKNSNNDKVIIQKTPKNLEMHC